MTRKEKFVALLKKRGYKSVNSFCLDNNLIQTNLNKRLKNETIRVDIDNLFLFAALLHVPIEEMLDIFYPDDMELNRQLVEEGKNNDSV